MHVNKQNKTKKNTGIKTGAREHPPCFSYIVKSGNNIVGDRQKTKYLPEREKTRLHLRK